MEHWWNEIDRGKPKYSGKSLSQCHFVHHKSHIIMEQRWNEIDKGKPKYSGKNLSQCHFVHHKSHMD
jgi:hypothetical protein